MTEEASAASVAVGGGASAEAAALERGNNAPGDGSSGVATEDSVGRSNRDGERPGADRSPAFADGDEIDLMLGEGEVEFEEGVGDFLTGLHDYIYKQDVETLRRLYDLDFNHLTERHFQGRRWPSIEKAVSYLHYQKRYHKLIETLYRELYYRHIFANLSDSVSWEDRKDSWTNYHSLMEYFISEACSDASNDQKLRLPTQWAWDIVDEYVFQFQDTCRWRCRLGKKIPAEGEEREQFLEQLRQSKEMWDPAQMLEHLHLLVESSGIRELMRDKRDELQRSNAQDLDLRYQLGYFAMVALLRTHILLGDYYLGLSIVEDIDLSTRALYWKVPCCHVTLFYHLGFAYMMIRRYSDAVRTLSQLLVFVSKQRGYLSNLSHQQSSMNKLVDKMHILVVLCSSLCNVRIDETVLQTIKERYSDKFYKLQQDNEETYRDLFSLAAPKCINPFIPSPENLKELEAMAQRQAEPQLRPLNVFLQEVAAQRQVANVNSFARLYHNIQLSKLASLMQVQDKDAEEAVRSEIMAVKHNSRQLVWKSGPLTSGEMVPTHSDTSVEFCMDHDLLHVKTQKTQKVFFDYFLKQIDRANYLLNMIVNSQPGRGGGQHGREGGGRYGGDRGGGYRQYNDGGRDRSERADGGGWGGGGDRGGDSRHARREEMVAH